MIISLLYGMKLFAEDKNDPNRYDYLYPINTLRNIALDAASTEMVLSLDADFLLSKDSFIYLTSDYMYSKMRKRMLTSSTAYVLSAW